MLEPFAVKRRPPRCTADEKAPGTRIGRRPGQIADSLKAEHRVVNVERDHWHVTVAVGGGSGDPGCHSSRLVDALLEDLAVLVLLVEHQLVGVLGSIQLADL